MVAPVGLFPRCPQKRQLTLTGKPAYKQMSSHRGGANQSGVETFEKWYFFQVQGNRIFKLLEYIEYL
jgi:hypothetical protein